MLIEKLLGGGNTPIVLQQMRFAQARHQLLAENIANVDTPGYVQRDLDESKFGKLLLDRVEAREKTNKPWTVGFDDIVGEVDRPEANILFHDRNNRSVEQLMTQVAKNAMKHNLYAELLRGAYGSIEQALRERPS